MLSTELQCPRNNYVNDKIGAILLTKEHLLSWF